MKVVIGGGTSGIGLATAEALAKDGHAVVVTGRDQQRLDAALRSLPKGVAGARADAADPEALRAFMEAIGSFDHLVLALGGSKGIGPFQDLDLNHLRDGFEEKFFPQLRMFQAALPHLRPGGSAVLVTAVSGHAKAPGTSGLAAINGALEIMVPILAKELKPLRVNAVSPGVVDTPWWSFLPEATRRDLFGQYAQAAPVGRVGHPADIARVISGLMEHTFITGQVITVDGGLGL